MPRLGTASCYPSARPPLSCNTTITGVGVLIENQNQSLAVLDTGGRKQGYGHAFDRPPFSRSGCSLLTCCNLAIRCALSFFFIKQHQSRGGRGITEITASKYVLTAPITLARTANSLAEDDDDDENVAPEISELEGKKLNGYQQGEGANEGAWLYIIYFCALTPHPNSSQPLPTQCT